MSHKLVTRSNCLSEALPTLNENYLCFFLQDEDPETSWKYLHENDLVALLNQIPLSDVFRHILQVEIVNGR